MPEMARLMAGGMSGCWRCIVQMLPRAAEARPHWSAAFRLQRCRTGLQHQPISALVAPSFTVLQSKGCALVAQWRVLTTQRRNRRSFPPAEPPPNALSYWF